MRSLEQALEDQHDLAALCRDRPLATREIFPGNAFYGHDRILKAYAGLPRDRPLKIVVPHGINLSQDFLWTAERDALLPAVFAFNDHRAQVYARGTRKLVVRTAAPFLYLLRLAERLPRPAREGLLFFPGHSTHRVRADMDFERLADALKNRERERGRVTVCVYWKDFEMGRHQPFAARGLRIVSAGHMYDPDFLWRLYHLCSTHAHAASNEVGRSLLYAMLSGCRTFLLRDFETTYRASDVHLREDHAPPSAMHAKVREAFSAEGDAAPRAQAELVDDLAGRAFLAKPEALRAQVAMCERLDLLGLARDPADGTWHAQIPCAPLRPLAALGNLGRRAAGHALRRVRLADPLP